MDSFQERKHKNFQVESDPFFGHLWIQTLIGRTNPGRHFGLGASRHMEKHLSLQLNSRPIRPRFRSAPQWTVFRSTNTKIFRLNPTLFLVTFEIKLWLGVLNQVDILAWAPPAIWKNTCHCSSIVAKYVQDSAHACFGQFSGAQTQKVSGWIRPFFWSPLKSDFDWAY